MKPHLDILYNFKNPVEMEIKVPQDSRFVNGVILAIFYCGGCVVSILLAEDLFALLFGFGLLLAGVYLVPAVLLDSRNMFMVSGATYILTEESISFQKGRISREIGWNDVKFVRLFFTSSSLRLSLCACFSQRFPSNRSVFVRLEGIETERTRIPLTRKLLEKHPDFAKAILICLLRKAILTESIASKSTSN